MCKGMKVLLGYRDIMELGVSKKTAYQIDKTGIEIDTLTLEKFLRTDRDGKSD